MKTLTIQGQKRESVGKKSTKALRNAELVPCVVYGGDEPVHFSTSVKSFKNLVYTADAHNVELEIDGGKLPAILQDIQYHPVTDAILHADFYQIHEDKPITMNIPVKLSGRSIGVSRGGNLHFILRKVRIKALPKDMPDVIDIDITKMRIGTKKYIADILDDKITFLHPDNAVIVAVKRSRVSLDDGDDDEDEEGAESAEASSGGGEESKEESNDEASA